MGLLGNEKAGIFWEMKKRGLSLRDREHKKKRKKNKEGISNHHHHPHR